MRVDLDQRLSLRWKVTIGATAVLSFALLLTALGVAGLLRRSIEFDTRALLTERVTAVAAQISAGDLPETLESTGREIGQVQVFDADGQVVSLTPGLADSTRFDVVPGPELGREVMTIVDGASIDNDTDERYQLIARTIDSPAGPMTVFAVTSLNSAKRAQNHLEFRLLLALPLLAAFTGLVIYRVVGRAMRPVEEMRRDVERISEGDLSSRVTPTASDDELARLGDTLNHMLERLENAAAQRELFAAAASHELRSPLSALRTELEVAQAYPDRADWPQTAEHSLIEIDRLEHLARDLRVLTRNRNVGAADRRCDLAALTRRELDRRSTGRVEHHAELEDAVVAADDDEVLQVLRNLLDNAERHAASTIDVRVDHEGSMVSLSVANDGPPIRLADREQIFEPFTRLDEARSLDTGGSGLGLAIVRSIMIEAGGSIEVNERLHGAEFIARFRAG